MMLSEGIYIPICFFFLLLALIVKFAPEDYPAFHRVFPYHDEHGFRFSLPAPITDANWPHIKRTGSNILFFFTALDAAANVLSYFGLLPWPYLTAAKWILLLGVLCFFAGASIAAYTHQKTEDGSAAQ